MAGYDGYRPLHWREEKAVVKRKMGKAEEEGEESEEVVERERGEKNEEEKEAKEKEKDAVVEKPRKKQKVTTAVKNEVAKVAPAEARTEASAEGPA
jgi:hypothetical protein